MLRSRPCRCSRGASAIEFLVGALPILLAGVVAFETSRWYMVRQAANYALMEAARAGSVAHANPQAIEAALERALLPLWGADATDAGQERARHRLHTARRELLQAHGLPLWQVAIISPHAGHFADFGTDDGPGGRRRIKHSYQAEQHAQLQQQGYRDGRGVTSGETIFDANTLTLELTYLHQPVVPGMRSLLRTLSLTTSGGTASDAIVQAGALPLRERVALEMQSSAYDWTQQGGANLRAPGLWPSSPQPPASTNPPFTDPNASLTQLPAQGAPTTAEHGHNDGTPPCFGASCNDAPLPPEANADNANPSPRADNGASPNADDPACGVIICCDA